MEWIYIPNLPKYRVSQHGLVIRDGHIDRRGRVRMQKVMKNHISTNGYPFVSIKGKNIYIHRLIAQLWIPNPLDKKEVHHKNGIRADFRIENLEWVTRTENQAHSWRELNRKATWTGKKTALSKVVNQYDVDGNLIGRYLSLNDAAKSFKCHPESIGQAIRSGSGYYKGNIFTYDSNMRSVRR